mgnify:CR=1 FL=1
MGGQPRPGLWTHGCDDRISSKIAPGGGENLFTSEGFDSFSVLEVMEVAKTEEGVEGTDLCHGVVALVFEGVTGQNTGLGVGQGLFWVAFLGEDLNLGKKFTAGQVCLVRRGPNVESEETTAQAVKLGGIDVVGQSQFFPHPCEEWARHVGAILVDQFQGHEDLMLSFGLRSKDRRLK